MTDSERVGEELRGKTLKVYIHLLRKGGSVGVREVQRELGFSSPSVAVHHIEKLESLGVVGKDEYGRYHLVRKVDVGVLQAFANIGRFTIPRLSFYGTFFTTLAIAYTIQFAGSLNLHAIAFSLAGAASFWYETLRVWRKRPF